jgi:(p)ppGpp synthase/HD superfamily hydrolase
MVELGQSDGLFTPAVMRALAYAAHVHRDQLRKGTETPYLSHLIAVAALVADDGGSEREVIAALLHDTAEDHGGQRRLEDITRRFGSDVEAIVRSLSDSLEESGRPKEAWRPRKERYLNHLWSERSEASLRVANADKLHNARSILADLRLQGDTVWERFSAHREDQLWYMGELARLFSTRRAGSVLASELARVFSDLDEEARARTSR